jgi:hypothetical protein
MAHITPEGGTYAILLMDLIETLAREQQIVSKGQILGHAAAHEIGHLLMGSNSHSPHGLMRAGWGTKELQDMAERRLLFSNSEGNRMRVRIAARLQGSPVTCAVPIQLTCRPVKHKIARWLSLRSGRSGSASTTPKFV